MADPESTPEELARTFSYYVRTLIEDDDIAKGTATLEVLESLAAIWEHRREYPELYQKVLNDLPVRNWREETMVVPTALIRLIVSAWTEYKRDAPGYSLGQKLEVESKTQGEQSQVYFLQKLRRDVVLARAVFMRRLTNKEAGLTAMSLEQAIAEAANEWNDKHPHDTVSSKTVERAWKKRRKIIGERAVAERIIKPPK